MTTIWQLQDAKNKLSELVERALNQGPQLITRHGKKAVVVIAYQDYKRMKQGQMKLSEFFRASPLTKVDLNLQRDKSLPRGDVRL